MRRRDFMRASAGASLTAMTAGSLLKSSAAFAAPGGAAGGPGSVLPYVGAGSTAAIQPFQLYNVTLGPGLLKEKQDRMISFARGYDERRFLVLFNQLAGRPNPPGVNAPGGWEDGGLLSGHWTGHFLTMLAQASAAGNTDLQDKLGWMVNELGDCQDALADKGLTVHPGYLGCKPEDTVLRIGPPRFAVYGSNQNTNSWAPWYTQHKIMRGFLDAYTLTGNDRAFEIVQKMAEWAFLALTLGDVMHPNYAGPPTRRDLNYMWDTYIAGELGGINEVIAEIAGAHGGPPVPGARAPLRQPRVAVRRLSREPRHPRLRARHPARAPAPAAPARQPARPGLHRLHADLRAERRSAVPHGRQELLGHGRPAPHVLARRSGRQLPGLQRQHRAVPEPRQHRQRDRRRAARRRAPPTTSIKLARNLFLHEPDPKYMDYVERGLFNQIAGSRQDTNTNSSPNVTYFQPLTPGNRRSYGNTGTCCGGTGMENHTKHQESVYFRSSDDTELWVNLFVPTTLTWPQRGFTVVQETDFPRQQSTKLTVNGSGQLTIKLRVPAWATKGYIGQAQRPGPAARRQAGHVREHRAQLERGRHDRDRHAVQHPDRAGEGPAGHAVGDVRPDAVPDPGHAARRARAATSSSRSTAISSSTATTRARRSRSRPA